MQIRQASYVISNQEVGKCPKADRPEFAFIGRSNVGKSSLINMITGQTRLAKTSGTPGKTQLINHFTIQSAPSAKQAVQQWYLVDLPGYGYAKISQKQRAGWEKMIEDYLRKRDNLINVFVLIDARHEPQKIDLEFIHDLGKWQIPFTLVFTKADKEKPGAVQRHVQQFLDALKATWQFLPQHFVSSSEKGMGREELRDFIQEKIADFYSGE